MRKYVQVDHRKQSMVMIQENRIFWLLNAEVEQTFQIALVMIAC